MKLEFVATDKKLNSTKIVSTYSKTLNSVQLKEETSLTKPIFMLGVGATEFSTYNYVKATFENNVIRYYFIDKFEVASNHCWYIYCTMDVLATYKTSILSNSLYVTRSASDKNLDIVDTLYPTLSKFYTVYTDITDISNVTIYDISSNDTYTESASNYFTKYPHTGGYYYIKVIGSVSGASPITYCMTYSEFIKFVKQIFQIDYSGEFPDIANGVARGVSNVLQYISECFWLPVKKPGITFLSRTINLGVYPITNIVSAEMIDAGGVLVSFRITNEGQRHPDFNHPQIERGHWLNTAPYTKRNLLFYPFGVYDLAQPEDAYSSYQDGDYLINLYVDLFTGQTMIRIFTTSENTHHQHLLVTDSKDYKIPIQLSETSVTLLGGLGNWLKSIGVKPSTSALGVPISYDVANSIREQASQPPLIEPKYGLGEYLQASGTSINTAGTTGAFLPYRIPPIIYISYCYIADGNYEHDGYPLCEERVLNTLNGYCLCKDNDIAIANATQDQLEMVKNYLVNGFFIE